VDYTRVGYSKNPYGTGVSQSGAGYESYGTNRSTGSGRGGPYNDVRIDKAISTKLMIITKYLTV